MARAHAANACAQSDSIKGLAQSIAKPAYHRLLTAEPALRRAVPTLIIAFLITICLGAFVQVIDQSRQKRAAMKRDLSALTEQDAHAAGFADLPALRAAQPRDGQLYRIRLRVAGPDPRVELRSRARLDAAERAELAKRLDRLDRASHIGPWTATVLDLIAGNPGTRAPDLAARLGRETLPFKRDVRKLKELGLTESLPVGYRLSPRGEAYLRG